MKPIIATASRVSATTSETRVWRRLLFAVIFATLAILVSYVFLISAGRFTTFPTHTISKAANVADYLDQQANGFLQGHLSLPREPAPELLAAPNPYDPKLISYWYWDAVYYKGKYFLLWGPVPALWIAAIKSVFGVRWIPDQVPVFFFACMLVVFTAAVLVVFLRKRQPASPVWPVVVGLFALAWSGPIPYMLGSAAAYEAAILAAQAWLVTALFLGLMALDASARGRLILASGAGLALGLACASRLSVMPAAALFACALTLALIKQATTKAAGGTLVPMVATGTPLMTVLALLGLFNYLRFDSPLETGMRYLLSIATPGGRFHLRYLPADVYSYFVRPPTFLRHFPFLAINEQAANVLPRWLTVPFGYYFERMAGLLFVTPFCAFAVLILPTMARAVAKTLMPARSPHTRDDDSDRTLALLLTGLFSLAFVAPLPLFFFYASAMRYLADGFVGVALLSTLGFATAIDRTSHRRRLQGCIAAIGILLVVFGAASSLLLWTKSYDNFLEKHNLELYRQLETFFDHLFGL
jgi:hypothetical protein